MRFGLYLLDATGKDITPGSSDYLVLTTDGIALAQELFHYVLGFACAMLTLTRNEQVLWSVVAP